MLAFLLKMVICFLCVFGFMISLFVIMHLIVEFLDYITYRIGKFFNVETLEEYMLWHVITISFLIAIIVTILMSKTFIS